MFASVHLRAGGRAARLSKQSTSIVLIITCTSSVKGKYDDLCHCSTDLCAGRARTVHSRLQRPCARSSQSLSHAVRTLAHSPPSYALFPALVPATSLHPLKQENIAFVIAAQAVLLVHERDF